MTTYNQRGVHQEIPGSSPPPNNQDQNYATRLKIANGSDRPMTGRELKRLRLKRSAIISQQRLHRHTSNHQAQPLRQNPERNDAFFQERSHNRAIERIYVDLAVEEIYKDIYDQGIFFVLEDHDSSDAEGSSGTAATANSSSADPEHELVVTAVPSPTPSIHTNESLPFDFDPIVKGIGDSGGVNGDHQVRNNTGNLPTAVNTNAASCSFIDLDMLQSDNCDHFKQILNDFEDNRIQKFISSATKCGPTVDNELCSNPVQPTGIRKRSIDTFGFTKTRQAAKDDPSKNSATRCVLHDDASDTASRSSIDSFGYASQQRQPTDTKARAKAVTNTASRSGIDSFRYAAQERPPMDSKARTNPDSDSEIPSSTTFSSRIQKLREDLDSLRNIHNYKSLNLSQDKSLDAFGFPDDGFADPLSAYIGRFLTDNGAQLSARCDSYPQEEQKQEQAIHHQGHDDFHDNTSVASSTKYTSSSLMVSKARRLRTLRLRAAANNLNLEGDHEYFEPCFRVAEEEEGGMNSEAMEFPGHFGQIIRAQSDEGRDMSCQSVVSEISLQSERLFLRLSPSFESIMDDMNSFCGGVVVDEDCNSAAQTCNSEDEYDKQINCEEIAGENVKDPPYDFDASVKTPPRHYFVCRLDSNMRNIRPKQRKTVPSGKPLDKAETKEPKDAIFRKVKCLVDGEYDESEESPTFSTLRRDDPSSVKEKNKENSFKNAMDLKVNHTFSTEEEDYASYNTGNSDEEIKSVEKEVLRSKDKVKICSILESYESCCGNPRE